MNVKVADDDKFMRCGCSGGQKRTEVTEEDREWVKNEWTKMEDDRY